LVNFFDTLSEHDWLFRNLGYNLQLYFKPKAEFLDEIMPTEEELLGQDFTIYHSSPKPKRKSSRSNSPKSSKKKSSTKPDFINTKVSDHPPDPTDIKLTPRRVPPNPTEVIGVKLFDQILSKRVLRRMSISHLSAIEKRLILTKIRSIFFIYDRKTIKLAEYSNRWQNLIPDYPEYTSNQNLQSIRHSLLKNKTKFYFDYQNILTKIIETIGYACKKKYIDDFTVKEILGNKFNFDIRNVILLDVFKLSGKDCRRLGTGIFENVFYGFEKELDRDKECSGSGSGIGGSDRGDLYAGGIGGGYAGD
jgi:hypothetical protein